MPFTLNPFTGQLDAVGAAGQRGPTGPGGGATGPTGPTGSQGIQGTAGSNGSNGSTGPTGSQGIQGTAGAQGIQGTAGSQGIQGTAGAQGIQGTAGAQGIQGTAGAQGIQGTAGSNGTNGSTGPTGPTGNNGSQGTAGTNGINAGDKFTYQTATGATGPGSGNIQFDNTTLASIANVYISTTDADSNAVGPLIATLGASTTTANSGYLTIIGDGAPGDLLVLDVTSAITSNTGWDNFSVSYVTSSGAFTNGQTVRLFYTRTGDQGIQGIQGTAGAQGIQGTAGAQGIQGTAGSQGIQGTAGAQGIQGTAGSQGIQGTAGAQGIQGTAGSNGTNGSTGPTGPTPYIPRVASTTSSATPTPNGDTTDQFELTAQIVTGAFQPPSTGSSIADGQKMIIQITSTGSGHAITWSGATGGYTGTSGVPLPSSFVTSKTLNVGFQYVTANSLNLWLCLASVQQ